MSVTKTENTKRLGIYIIIAGLYLSALFTPAIDGHWGIKIFFAGILSITMDWEAWPFFIMWLSNILFYKCLSDFLGDRKSKPVLMALAVFLASVVPLYRDVVFKMSNMFQHFQIGYYLWLSSYIALFLAQYFLSKKEVSK